MYRVFKGAVKGIYNRWSTMTDPISFVNLQNIGGIIIFDMNVLYISIYLSYLSLNKISYNLLVLEVLKMRN